MNSCSLSEILVSSDVEKESMYGQATLHRRLHELESTRRETLACERIVE